MIIQIIYKLNPTPFTLRALLRWWRKTIEMWWWWCTGKQNNRNVVAVVVVEGKQQKYSGGLRRHFGNLVINYAGLTPFQTVPVFSQKCQRFRFKHPFTSMIAGMTGSGKTAWVRSLLQQASETIYPPPERIVWCYSQWQPAYTQMLVAMPHIEFVKGIPTALEQDSYFDVNKRNLIVFDDQMIDASKDERIVNLFTRDSHHCNLRVIYIVQNLFP